MATAYDIAPEDMQEMVATIAAEHHLRLRGRCVQVMTRDKAAKAKGRTILAEAFIPPAKMRPLLVQGVDYVLMVAADEWQAADLAQRRAVVDHELCHCGLNEDGEPTIEPHDLEEFAAVAKRHGAWRKDGRAAAVQLAFSLHDCQGELRVVTGKLAAEA